MLALGRAQKAVPAAWRVPVLTTTATTTAGITELLEQLHLHSVFAERTGLQAERRAARTEIAVETVVLEHVQRLLASEDGRAELRAMASGASTGDGDTHAGAATLWNWIVRQSF